MVITVKLSQASHTFATVSCLTHSRRSFSWRSLTVTKKHTKNMAEVMTKTNPSTFLSGIIGSQVNVKLHNGVAYVGTLQSIDGFMNIVLASGAEYVNGVANGVKYGDVFIRGNNGMY